MKRRRVLVIAYYFPPMGLSGVQRVAKFVKYLPDWGWEPVVLTVEPGGYFAYDESLLEELIARDITIVRTTSWDPTRLFGRRRTVAMPDERARHWLSTLSQFFFVPDNKVGWMPPALRKGKELLSSLDVDAIFSSAPPYTAHLVAARLARRAGCPLVTDFRDDWLGNPRHVYPTPLHRRVNEWMERGVLRQSDVVTTINDPLRASLAVRVDGERHRPAFRILPQGFDPEDFDGVGGKHGAEVSSRMRIVYSGIFYDAQTPDFFLRGLARLVRGSPERRAQMDVVFVGLVPPASQELIRRLGLDDVVRCVGYLPHEDAVRQLVEADVLWLTVGRQEGEEMISTGKLFEYLGARKPILGLVPEGAARRTLEASGAGVVVDPDDVAGIAEALDTLVDAWERDALPQPDPSFVERFDRRSIARSLASLLDEMVG